MEAYVTRKKRKTASGDGIETGTLIRQGHDDEDDTDLKLAVLASMYPEAHDSVLLDSLISADGSVEEASKSLAILAGGQDEPHVDITRLRSPIKGIGHQSSLALYNVSRSTTLGNTKPLTKKGQTLHLFSPEDVAANTPCSIIHNFLPTAEADALLEELLNEARTYESATFKLFDNVVKSPHTACFYVESIEERKRQQTEYLYNGSNLTDIRELTSQMRQVSPKVKAAVNSEINERIKTHYPDGNKLKYQSSEVWEPNACFCNCYKDGSESVGYHSDQLTYLGPRAVIGSISLGVAREFRVRKIVARDAEEYDQGDSRADAEGQIAIHLPHNSLLVMHAEMQEEWKHSIAPARAIDPHPIAGNKRINITYRHYREPFHPKYTPRCKCNIATVLKCVQKRKENRGRYMWMCHAGNSPGKEGCSFFQWAKFDDDGNPEWAKMVAKSSKS